MAGVDENVVPLTMSAEDFKENRPLDIVAHSNQEMVEMLLDGLR